MLSPDRPDVFGPTQKILLKVLGEIFFFPIFPQCRIGNEYFRFGSVSFFGSVRLAAISPTDRLVIKAVSNADKIMYKCEDQSQYFGDKWRKNAQETMGPSFNVAVYFETTAVF